MDTLSKSDLASKIAATAGIAYGPAMRAINAMTAEISAATAAGKAIGLPGFGKFMPKTRKARKARNPRTGETIQVPETTVLSFKPSKSK